MWSFSLLQFKSNVGENEELFFRLSLLPFFCEAPEKSLRTLLQHASKMSPLPGIQVAERGAPVEAVFLVLQGYVGSYAEDGSDAGCLVDLMGINSFVGLPELFLARPHPYTYRTFGGTHILRIPAETLLGILDSDWNLQRSIMGGLSRRIHGLVQQIDSLKTQRAEQRLAAHFLECIEHNAGALEFRLAYDKKDLAAHLGLVPESLSRALKRLKDHGVQARGRSISIKDRQALMDTLVSPRSMV